MKITMTLAAARINAGLKQEEAARLLGVTRATVSNWERGVHAPTSENIMKIVELYGVSLENLIISRPMW